jgi:uncharacterized protein YejL (UPF0352 family)
MSEWAALLDRHFEMVALTVIAVALMVTSAINRRDR